MRPSERPISHFVGGIASSLTRARSVAVTATWISAGVWTNIFMVTLKPYKSADSPNSVDDDQWKHDPTVLTCLRPTLMFRCRPHH